MDRAAASRPQLSRPSTCRTYCRFPPVWRPSSSPTDARSLRRSAAIRTRSASMLRNGRMLMLIIPSGVKIYLALGHTDMRKGFDSLAVLVQGMLKKDPFSGHLFAFRGIKADTMKILFWDGNGLCLFTKRLQQGRFIWPSLCEPGGTVTLTPAQVAMLIEGIDWRTPEHTWKPALAG